MATLVGYGDRLLSVTGRPTWMKRGSVPLSSYWGGGGVAVAGGGVISYERLYETQPWIAISTNKLARQISRLPLKVYERNSQNEKTRVDATDPLARLLERPATRRGPVHLKQTIALPMLVHGNSLLGKVREEAGAPPTGLVPLRWPYLEARHVNGEIVAWATTQGGDTAYIPLEDTVHFGWEAPDRCLGVSPLQQLGVTLQAEDAAQRYGSATFENAARPGLVISLAPDAPNDPELRKEIEEKVRASHGGVANAFRPMVIGGGAKVESAGHTAHEAELIEIRKLNREEVAAVYDIPPPLIGILDHATYSNVSEMHSMLYKTVLGPWLVLIEETIKAQLIDGEQAFEGRFVEFDLAEVLKGDTLEEIQALREGIQTGLMTPNEGRQIRNLPRVDDEAADQLYMPTNNMTPLGQEPAAPQLQVALSRAQARVAEKAANGTLEDSDPDLGRIRAARND